MTTRLRREKEQIEGELNPLVNKFAQMKNNIELKKQEIAALEGKSEKIKSEIEACKN